MQEGGLTDVAIEVLHRLLSHVIHGPRDQVGVGDDQVTAFLETLKKGLCESACSVCCTEIFSVFPFFLIYPKNENNDHFRRRMRKISFFTCSRTHPLS